MSFISSFSFLDQYWPLFFKGLWITIALAVSSIILGSILGLILTLMKRSKFRVVSIIAKAYIGFIRDTPLLVQFYIVYIALPLLIGVNIPDFATGMIALTLYSAAYIAEIFRAGIESISLGQFEAANSLGMSNYRTMKDIVLPQAIGNIMPALGNQFIGNVKDSSLVSVLGIADLMYQAQVVRGSTALGLQPVLVVSLIYLVLTWLLNVLLNFGERRMKANDIS